MEEPDLGGRSVLFRAVDVDTARETPLRQTSVTLKSGRSFTVAAPLSDFKLRWERELALERSLSDVVALLRRIAQNTAIPNLP